MKYNGELQAAVTEDQLKQLYYQYAKIYHPDRGGSKEAFQELSNDYERLFNKLKGFHQAKNGGFYHAETKEKPSYYRDIINKLMKIKGLHIDVIGCFLWISGKTRENKEALKAAGCKYSANKKKWYVSPQGYHKLSKKAYTFEDIKKTFGIAGSFDTGRRSSGRSKALTV